jgi:hypothetical protein
MMEKRRWARLRQSWFLFGKFSCVLTKGPS